MLEQSPQMLEQSPQWFSRAFISYEDRTNYLDGLKLLCLSFAKHCPDERLRLFFPEIPSALLEWVEQKHIKNIELKKIETTVNGWGVKAELLLVCLEQGFKEVVWIDSDILITNSIAQAIDKKENDAIILANCPGISDGRRATTWNLKVCRTFDSLINTCFIRVTPSHKELLSTWKSLISSSKFQLIQKNKFQERPSYLFGDQDLLEGLLMSENFCLIPVYFMRHGCEIVHASSIYSVTDRFKVLLRHFKTRQSPIMLHAHGIKPWMLVHRKPSSFNLTDVLVELSPYSKAATSYKELLESNTEWMKPRTLLGNLCNFISLYNPHLRGIPVLVLKKVSKHVPKAK
jgi:hypothetical protein